MKQCLAVVMAVVFFAACSDSSATLDKPAPTKPDDTAETTVAATALSITVAEDGAATFDLKADVAPEEAQVAFEAASQPAHGTLSLSGAEVTYTPDPDFHGKDTFTFVATADGVKSKAATVTLTVTPVNDAPEASASAKTTPEDTPLAGTVTGADVDDTALTFALVTPPASGTLTLNAGGAYSYVPATDYTGAVSFTFTSNDGELTSAPAQVSITITPVNDAPLAYASYVTTFEDAAFGGLLMSADVDGPGAAYAVVTQPTLGSVAVTAATGAYTYTPAANANGDDSFAFQVSDGTASSTLAWVNVTVVAVNDAPASADASVGATEDTVKTGAVAGSDIDSVLLTYAVVTQPTSGTLTFYASSGTYAYTPTANFNGSDSFTYTVHDGALYSPVATVTLNVAAVNDTPAAYAVYVTTAEDAAVNGGLMATDVESSLTYAIVAQPAKGSVSLTASTGAFTYTPAANANGSDSFTYRANDGSVNSNTATVYVAITPAPDAPVAGNATKNATEDTFTTGVLAGSDADNDILTYSLVTAPTKGTVTVYATSGTYAYTPSLNANGADAFTYAVWDGALGSNVGRITVNIAPVNDAPSASAATAATDEETLVAGTLTGADIDGDALTYSVYTSPANGVLVITGATGDYTYTPAANFYGSDVFWFRSRDAVLYSAPASVFVSVAPVNDAPVAQSFSASTGMNQITSGVLPASDSDGDALTFEIVADATNGTAVVTNAATGEATYTPNAAFDGVDTFTFRVFDGTVYSSIATGTILVKRAPVLSALAPATGVTGNPLVLSGSYFYDLVGEVWIGGIRADVISWRNTAAAVTVPALPAGSYAVTVATGGGVSGSLTYRVVPHVSSFAPRFGSPGDSITLQGTSLGSSAGVVLVAGLPATIDTWTDSSISVRLPGGLVTGATTIAITTAGAEPANPFEIQVRPSDMWITAGAPERRQAHSTVWTGTEMIVWGGYDSERTIYFDSGGRYNPATDAWLPLTRTGAPSARYQHQAVWTGDRMVVFGGWSPVDLYAAAGRRYDPASDSWAPMNMTGAPVARIEFSMIWTGSRVVVWGGRELTTAGVNTGGRYDPVADQWTATSTAGAASVRRLHGAVWTGSEMIVWGGVSGSTNLNTGAPYDPETDSWGAPLPVTNAPSIRRYPGMVWTGDEMIVWGGFGSTSLADGARYNVAARLWYALPATNAPAARRLHTAVWTGTEMLIWGGLGGQSLNTGARWSKASNQWAALPMANAPMYRYGHSGVWTGEELILWGGYHSWAPLHYDDGARYRPAANSWSPMGAGDTVGRRYHSAVWTGSEMIAWSGYDGIQNTKTGVRYNPATNTWRPTSLVGAPDGRQLHSAIWSGTEMIIWGGSSPSVYVPARYNPASDVWTLSTSGASRNFYSGASAWSGTEMLVFGGYSNPNGYRYNPVAETWSQMSTAGQPPSRANMAYVWTDSELLIWGGYDTVPQFFGDGFAYNPASNTWRALSAVSAPSIRGSAAAVWTGSEMIVWGGYYYDGAIGYYYNDGGRYDLAANTWAPLPALNAPPGRLSHTAVWTGDVMVVWGGSTGGATTVLDTGGRYSPASNTWLPTTQLSAAGKRSNHTAVWTGSMMLVYGGGPMFPNRVDPSAIYVP